MWFQFKTDFSTSSEPRSQRQGQKLQDSETRLDAETRLGEHSPPSVEQLPEAMGERSPFADYLRGEEEALDAC